VRAGDCESWRLLGPAATHPLTPWKFVRQRGPEVVRVQVLIEKSELSTFDRVGLSGVPQFGGSREVPDLEPMITLSLGKQGESITFFSEADDSAPSLEFEVRLAPGATGPESHIHPLQSERFTVSSGRMIVVANGVTREIDEGESVMVAPGEAHSFANASAGDPLVFRCTVEPALHFQWFLTEAAKSTIRGGGSWKDMPFLEAVYILNQIRGEYLLAGIPAGIENAMFALVARTAVALGRTKLISPR
jgi:quercetin dioxygenase-like cupin family protein